MNINCVWQVIANKVITIKLRILQCQYLYHNICTGYPFCLEGLYLKYDLRTNDIIANNAFANVFVCFCGVPFDESVFVRWHTGPMLSLNCKKF